MRKISAPAPLPRLAARPLGLLLLVFAAAMAGCAAVGFAMRDAAGSVSMLISAGFCAATGVILSRWGKGVKQRLGRREALVVVSAAWVAAGIFGGLPFWLGADFTAIDAFFEATSGFTTTGATILPEIADRLSPPLHLWRMSTHWFGGLGIVVLFVAIFPALGVGGKHLFRSEAPGPKSEGLAPRIRDTANALLKVYALLTLLEVLLLMGAGMPLFDAVTHSMSTLGTGGFSTKNGSIAEYDNLAYEIIITVFMVVAGMNFGLFHEARRRGWKAFWSNIEFRVYMGIFALATALIAINLWGTVHEGLGASLRYAAFQVASISTTTGYGTDDFEQWPAFARSVLVMLYFIGGSAGSTAGGLKVIRIIIIVQVIANEVRRGYRPALVAPVRMGNQVVPQGVVVETLATGAVFAVTVVAGALCVALFDPVDVTTAFMASLACVANVGPGLGAVGPTDNFGFLSGASKLVLSVCMLLGRLEFFTLLALAAPRFWRR